MEVGKLGLGRYAGQSIMINDDIVIRVNGTERDGLVRITIEAPKEYVVHRREIWEKIQQQKSKCDDAL